MRHSYQTTLPVRRQFGRVETGRVNRNNPEKLDAVTDVRYTKKYRLTTHALDGLRLDHVEREGWSDAIQKLLATREGRKKLRAMRHRHETGGEVYGIV